MVSKANYVFRCSMALPMNKSINTSQPLHQIIFQAKKMKKVFKLQLIRTIFNSKKNPFSRFIADWSIENMNPDVIPFKMCIMNLDVIPFKMCIMNPDVIPFKMCIMNPDVIPFKMCIMNPDVILYKMYIMNPDVILWGKTQ